MNFRQLISKEKTHKMQEAVINEADKKINVATSILFF